MLAPRTSNLPVVLEPLAAAFSDFGWQDWLWSAGLLAIGYAAGRVAAWLATSALARWARSTETVLDDALLEHIPRPLKVVLPVLGMRLASAGVSLPDRVQDALAHLLLVGTILGVGWLALSALAVVETCIRQRFDLSGADSFRARGVHTQTRALKNIVGFLVITLTIAFALMTFEPVRQLGTGLLASAGAAGVVIGFAAQRSIATIVAGLQLAMAQPIRVDDVVIVEGEWGRVEEITLTYVVIRIWDLRRLVVPITYFIEKPFQNWTRASSELLGAVELHLDYSVPLAELRAELTRILEASPDWDGKVNSVQVTATNEKTMVVRPLVSAADAGKLWNLRCEVREKLVDFVQRTHPRALPRHRAEMRDAS